MKKSHKMNRFVLGFVKLTGAIPALLFMKPKVYKLNNTTKRSLPKKAILMSNHTSLLDFVLYLMVFFGRSIHFLMAEVLFNKGKLFGWFLYKIGGIFVDRNNYTFSFVEKCLDVLDKNGIVCIFPQGRLPVKGKAFPFKPGIVLVALRTDAPIVPVYTDGSYGISKRARVMIGDEINIRDYVKSENPTDDELTELAAILEKKTYELKDELERRLKAENGK